MEDKYTIKNLLVADLQIYIENPRFDPVEDQRQAITTMLEDQEDKIYRLADDIVNVGLNPSELPIVIQNEADEKKYIVLEGNRRITAIKLLNNPKLADDSFKTIRGKKFKKLTERFSQQPINRVSCVIFYHSADAFRWIRLRHTGENEGIGTSKWDAHQVARFDARVSGKASSSLQVIDFLRQSSTFDPSLQAQLAAVNLSTLERLMGSTHVKDFLGLSIKNGKLYSSIDKLELEKGFKKIVGDLLKGLSARAIDKKEDRQSYIAAFTPEFTPDKDRKTTESWEITTPQQSIPSLLSVQSSTSSTSPTANPKPKKPLPLSTDREYLIPKTCVIKISDTRINTIFKELKELKVNDFTNAVSVLFRVFIELSVDVYLVKYPQKGIKKMSSLKDKVEKVATHMQDRTFADSATLKGILISVNNNNDILSVDTFNAYVHNRQLSPVSRDLKLSWENVQPFVEIIWENI